MTPAMLVALGEKGVKTLDDLGDLAGDELVEAVQAVAKLTQDEANAIIMAARAHWFEEADAAAPAKE
jgi:N utilization substance protein A